jgi:hypothetical protein
MARVMSVAIAVFSVLAVLAVRAEDGPEAETTGIARSAARAATWLVAVVIALAASHERSLSDRRDGVELFVFARGLEPSRLTLVRFLAAFRFAARWMLVPVIASAVASLAAAGAPKLLVTRALVLVALSFFAVVTCAVMGSLGAIADAVAPRRGRTLVIAVLALSGFVAELAKDPALSVTGALFTLLNGLLYVARGGVA